MPPTPSTAFQSLGTPVPKLSAAHFASSHTARLFHPPTTYVKASSRPAVPAQWARTRPLHNNWRLTITSARRPQENRRLLILFRIHTRTPLASQPIHLQGCPTWAPSLRKKTAPVSSHLQVYPHRADRCIIKNGSTHQMQKSWALRRMGEPTARAQLQASSYIHRLTAQISQPSGQQSSAGHACLTHRTNLHNTRTRAPGCADRPALTAPSPRASRVRRAAPTKPAYSPRRLDSKPCSVASARLCDRQLLAARAV